jgi:hypothetical protein
MLVFLLLALLALAPAPGSAAAAASTVSVPPPIMSWYLGANCVGTPGGVVQITMGCADYLVFGTILSLMVTLQPNSTRLYNIASFVDSGCTGALGVLFVNIPYPGASTTCTADTTLDRCVAAGGGQHTH